MSIPPSKPILTVSALRPARTSPRTTISNLLAHFNATPLAPCAYQFPITSAPEFFALANIITSVGIGAIANLTASIAATDAVLTAGTVTIITVEARHDAFFRSTAGQVANPAPFVRHSLRARLSYTVTSDTLPRTPAYPANGPSTSPCPS
jgi:hypothetical protein